MNRRIFSLLILFVFIITSGFGCKNNLFAPAEERAALKPVKLTYWGVWDSPEQINSIISAYRKKHPTVSITYRKFRYDEYERELLEAWADGRGPDIFAIPATWLKDYQARLEPAPKTMKVPVYEMTGQIKQEPTLVLKTLSSYTTNSIKEKFIPVVYDDVILGGKIYGLPHYVDTMVTFTNRTLLDKSGIPEPMADFHELVDQVPQLTKVDQNSRIIQSAVALGGTENVPRHFDILSNIMMQNGVPLDGSKFEPTPTKDARNRMIGAIGYYTDFANPGKASYSWNEDMSNAFELFVGGKLAYFFGYSYHADEIRDRGVSFDWDIKNFPQTKGAEGTKYYANYWVNVVSNKSKNTSLAWSFVQETAGESMVKSFLTKHKKPTALRSLIESQKSDPDTKAYAEQLLTADSWYEGYDIDLTEQYTTEFLDQVLSGEISLGSDTEAFDNFISKIKKTYVKK